MTSSSRHFKKLNDYLDPGAKPHKRIKSVLSFVEVRTLHGIAPESNDML
jgi:hypothetical protein